MEQYVDFGGLLFSLLQKKPAAADIERIVKDAVALEKAFILEESELSHSMPNRSKATAQNISSAASHPESALRGADPCLKCVLVCAT